MRKPKLINVTWIVLIAVILALAGCASASKMLERAESAWAAGQYSSAIYFALESYEKAVDKNKEPADIAAAKAFLEDRFPLANDYILDRAEQQLNGSDAEKAEAWRTFETLVAMNRRVRDSIASGFLATQDYSDQLQKAKEVAAQLKYNKAMELMSLDRRDSYIEAYGLFNEIDGFVPDYRDIRVRAEQCREAATLVVALSDRELVIDGDGEAPSPDGITSSVMDSVESFIGSNDNPAFLNFITAGSASEAAASSAVLFVEIQGKVNIDSDVDSTNYSNFGQVEWERSYDGNPTLIVTRISDSRTEAASADVSLEQSVTLSCQPIRIESTQMSEVDYTGKFNNPDWINSQLNQVKNGFKQDGSQGYLVVWGELEYGGSLEILDSADVYTAEGYVEMPISSSLWSPTVTFVNKGLEDFMAFTDMNLVSRLSGELVDDFLSSSAVEELLSELDD